MVFKYYLFGKEVSAKEYLDYDKSLLQSMIAISDSSDWLEEDGTQKWFNDRSIEDFEKRNRDPGFQELMKNDTDYKKVFKECWDKCKKKVSLRKNEKYSDYVVPEECKVLEILENKTNRLYRIDYADEDKIGYSVTDRHITGLALNMPSSHSLTYLPEEICNLSSLQDLYLVRNKLNQLPEKIGNLKSLIHLNLWGNQLRTLPLNIKNLSGLKSLILVGNDTLIPLSDSVKNALFTLKYYGCAILGIEGKDLIPEKFSEDIADKLINNVAEKIVDEYMNKILEFRETKEDIEKATILLGSETVQKLFDMRETEKNIVLESNQEKPIENQSINNQEVVKKINQMINILNAKNEDGIDEIDKIFGIIIMDAIASGMKRFEPKNELDRKMDKLIRQKWDKMVPEWREIDLDSIAGQLLMNFSKEIEEKKLRIVEEKGLLMKNNSIKI